MKKNTYEIVTERIIELLKAGCAPWRRPWKTTCFDGQCGLFFNLVSKRPYRGANVFMLAAANYASPWWVTYNQAKSLGGNVRRGEKGYPIIFWRQVPIKDEDEGTTRMVPFLRCYTVFNVEQCEGLESKIPKTETAEAPAEGTRTFTEADDVVENMPKRPQIFHVGERACYVPTKDTVHMPEPTSFDKLANYYSVLFHELTHSTGHPCRLHRKGNGGSAGDWSDYGSLEYAREELVAEMGAAFICGALGIESDLDNNAAYLEHWIGKLKNDPKLFVYAAGQAQKAADYILRRNREAEEGGGAGDTTES